MAGGIVADASTGKVPVNQAVFTLLMGCIIALSSSAGMLLGYDNGVTGGVLAHPGFEASFMQHRVGDVTSSSQWCKFADIRLQLFTSSLFLTGIIGALLGMRTCERYGRKKTMMFGGVCFLAGAILLAAAFTWAQLVVGRLVLGLGVGLATMATPFYMNEMTPPQWRGASTIIFQLFITIGILVAQVITYHTAHLDYGWRIALGAAGAPALLLVVATAALPESPQWLMVKGRLDEAAAVLRKVYGVGDVTLAMEQLSCAVTTRAANPRGLRLLFTRKYLPQLAMATVIPAAQQLTGINAIMFYAPQVFLATGQSTTNALLSSVIIGLVNVAATVVAILAVERLGRRFLLLQGGVQMVITQVIVAMLLRQSSEGVASSPVALALVSMICLYVAAFAWSWGPLGWLVPTELQPLETRAAGTAVNTCVNFGFTFLIGQVFLSMLCGMKWGVFIFFAGCVALACVFVYLTLPETKGLTSEEIGEVLKQHNMWGPLIRNAEQQEAAAVKADAV